MIPIAELTESPTFIADQLVPPFVEADNDVFAIPANRLLPLMANESVFVAGKPPPTAAQLVPPFVVTYTPLPVAA